MFILSIVVVIMLPRICTRKTRLFYGFRVVFLVAGSRTAVDFFVRGKTTSYPELLRFAVLFDMQYTSKMCLEILFVLTKVCV